MQKSTGFAGIMALALVAFAPAANAALIQDLGEIDPTGTDFSRSFVRFFGLGSPLGAFVDEYTFSLKNPSTGALGGVVGFDFGFVDLTINSVSLSGGGQSLTDTTPGQFAFSNLVAGVQYTLAVGGTLGSNSLDLGAGYYEGTIRAAGPTRVPEPATFALLGLGLLGIAAARRRTAG